MENEETGRAWIELDQAALAHNLRRLQELLPHGCRLMPAVKANAYGHGALPVAQALQRLGVTSFCVATLDEGIALRRGGIGGEILILGYTAPSLFPRLAEYRLTQTVVDAAYGAALGHSGLPLAVHVGVDTGMRRIGLDSGDLDAIANLWSYRNLRVGGVFSHLCAADGDNPASRALTLRQAAALQAVVDGLHRRGISGFKVHLLGSYGVLNYPWLGGDYARVGLALYGVLSRQDDRVAAPLPLQPVLRLKARVACIHTLASGETAGYGPSYTASGRRRLAAVCIGYADGVPRSLSGRGYALLHGVRVPMAARICMDQLLLDVTDVPDAAPGDIVTLIGRDGGEVVTATDWAAWAGTITNEILSRLGPRLPRLTC